MPTTRRNFIKMVAAAGVLPFGLKSVVNADDTDLKINSNDLSKFRNKNVEILYFPSIGETLPSIYIRESGKPKTAIEIDLCSQPGNELQEEVAKILTALKKAQPESITFDEKKSPLAQARDSYDQSAIQAIEKFLNISSGSKREKLTSLSKRVN